MKHWDSGWITKNRNVSYSCRLAEFLVFLKILVRGILECIERLLYIPILSSSLRLLSPIIAANRIAPTRVRSTSGTGSSTLSINTEYVYCDPSGRSQGSFDTG
jgi:hypothetical protein